MKSERSLTTSLGKSILETNWRKISKFRLIIYFLGTFEQLDLCLSQKWESLVDKSLQNPREIVKHQHRQPISDYTSQFSICRLKWVRFHCSCIYSSWLCGTPNQDMPGKLMNYLLMVNINNVLINVSLINFPWRLLC